MKKVKINTRNGFTLLEILLALTIVGVIAAFTIGISYSIRNMTKVNSTKSRMEEIAAKAKQYYRGHGSLPTAGGTPADSVPVGASDLNMEQKFRLDAWGQYFYYYVEPTGGIPQSGIEGIIYSYGPDQNFDTTPPATTPSNDDIVVLINVSEKAVEIVLEELKVLQSKVKAFDAVYEGLDNDGDGTVDEDGCVEMDTTNFTGCPPIPTATGANCDPNCGTATLDEIDDNSIDSYDCISLGVIVNRSALEFIMAHYSLATDYQADPWGNNYVWGRSGLSFTDVGGGTISSSDSQYHKFFSAGPNGLTGNDAGVSDDIIP